MKSESDRFKLKEDLLEGAEVIILDMDGTLYELDGDNGEFSSSSLCRQMFENTIQFIVDREGVSKGEAENIMSEALKHEVGMSKYLADRYGLSRKDCFDMTWNIDPKGIVQNFEEAVKVVRKLKGMGKTLILLTQAPSVWQKRVIEHIGLEDIFEMVITGEDFGDKTEVLVKILGEYESLSMLSVGDQLKTDIEPALRLGMEAILVSGPNDLIKLIE